jgi:serralysin
MALSKWSDTQVVNQLDSGATWSGSTITYSFAMSTAGIYTGSGENNGFSALSTSQQQAAELAIKLWDDLIAPDLQKVASGSTAYSSNIEFGNSTKAVDYAHAYFPTVGSVWFNPSYSSGDNNLAAPKPGDHGFATYVHEIGHAFGLEHMGEYNGAWNSGASSYQDSTVYSIMSYYGPSWGSGSENGEGQVAWADWVGADGNLYSPQTPMLNDIMAMQAMYGVETTTRTDDTVYGFNSTITDATKAIFDFEQNENPILSIFDSAGIDTLDLSGWSTSSTIDLAPGSFSSCNSMTSNISIARTCYIENAIGGAGADKISGNTLSNVLLGGAGNDILYGLAGDDRINGGSGIDTIDGGEGIDYVLFDDEWDAIDFTFQSATMVLTFTGWSMGIDTVTNVEYFTDRNNVTRSFTDLTGTLIVEPEPASALSLAIEALNPEVAEGNFGSFFTETSSFLVSLSEASAEAVTVDWNLAFGVATSDARASDFVGPISGTVTFAAGVTEATISVYIDGDGTVEGDETFSVQLSNASPGVTIADGMASATILNDDPLQVYGTSRNNVLRGSAMNEDIYGLGGNDTLIGNGGSDYLDGGSGNDKMYGGTGDDFYFVAQSKDKVIEKSGEGTDTVLTTLSSYALGAHVENLVFTGYKGFRGTGNSLDNLIIGGGGNDTLNGGLGADTLWGDWGRDNFDFTTRLGSGNIDAVMDFDALDDKVRLSNSVFKALGKKKGALAAAAFNVGTTASDSSDRIIFDSDSGALYYDPDGTGSASCRRRRSPSAARRSGRGSRLRACAPRPRPSRASRGARRSRGSGRAAARRCR